MSEVSFVEGFGKATLIAIAALLGTVTGCGGISQSTSRSTVTVHDTVAAQPPSYPTAVTSPTRERTPAQPATSIPGDGTFRVGVDVQPGTYRSPGPSKDVSCSWRRLSSFSDNTSAWIDSGSSYGQQYVTIAASDVAFWNQFCQTWTLVSPAAGAGSGSSVSVPPPTAQSAVLPDADNQGFTTYQGAARCHGSDLAAQIVRTLKSAVVVCQTSQSTYYYRGLRLSDYGTIELGGAVPLGSGFTVSNTDGTVYAVSHSGLSIRTGAETYSEAAVESAP